MQSELDDIQRWYESQCDEDWEHQYGVRIDTLDNPGWMLEIDLAETTLAQRPFPRAELRSSEREWYVCEVAAEKFRGYGGPLMLGTMMRVFLDWAHKAGAEGVRPAG